MSRRKRPVNPVLMQVVSVCCGRDAILSGSSPNWRIEQPYTGYAGSGLAVQDTASIPRVLHTDWENAGEGLEGEYDESNPDDKNFLRFSVSSRPVPTSDSLESDSLWEQVDDASYCTRVPVTTPDLVQVRLLCAIHNEARRGLEGSQSIKKTMARMSWISPHDLPDGIHADTERRKERRGSTSKAKTPSVHTGIER